MYQAYLLFKNVCKIPKFVVLKILVLSDIERYAPISIVYHIKWIIPITFDHMLSNRDYYYALAKEFNNVNLRIKLANDCKSVRILREAVFRQHFCVIVRTGKITRTLIQEAVDNEYYESLKHIKKIMIDGGDVIASVACKSGNFNVFKFCGLNGVFIAKEELFLSAVYNNYPHLLKYILACGFKDVKANKHVAIKFTCEFCDTDMIKILINAKADIHVGKEKPLKLAVRGGKLANIKYLVENKANIHINNGILLRKAINLGHLQIVKYLISKKINTSVIDKINWTNTNKHIAEYLGI